MSDKNQTRDKFGSRFGVIAAAAGSAVGLGNIWKFPYIAGIYGGAAFLFVYLAFIVAIGLPVMLSELVIGRKSQRNAFGAFKVLAPGTPWKSGRRAPGGSPRCSIRADCGPESG